MEVKIIQLLISHPLAFSPYILYSLQAGYEDAHVIYIGINSIHWISSHCEFFHVGEGMSNM